MLLKNLLNSIASFWPLPRTLGTGFLTPAAGQGQFSQPATSRNSLQQELNWIQQLLPQHDLVLGKLLNDQKPENPLKKERKNLMEKTSSTLFERRRRVITERIQRNHESQVIIRRFIKCALSGFVASHMLIDAAEKYLETYRGEDD